jgi:hypothetical protein
MALKTRRDLVDEALGVLGVVGSGQSPEVEDVAKVNGKIDATIDDLRAQDVIYVPDYNEIDTEIFLDLATCVAGKCMADFGLANDPRITAMAVAAENSLRLKSAQGPTYATLRTTYF